METNMRITDYTDKEIIDSVKEFDSIEGFEKESENLEELNIYSKIMIDGIEKEQLKKYLNK